MGIEDKKIPLSLSLSQRTWKRIDDRCESRGRSDMVERIINLYFDREERKTIEELIEEKNSHESKIREINSRIDVLNGNRERDNERDMQKKKEKRNETRAKKLKDFWIFSSLDRIEEKRNEFIEKAGDVDTKWYFDAVDSLREANPDYERFIGVANLQEYLESQNNNQQNN